MTKSYSAGLPPDSPGKTMFSFHQLNRIAKSVLLCGLFLGSLARNASAQGTPPTALSYTTPGVATKENFDTLAASGSSSNVPTGFGFVESGSNANTTYTGGTGSSTTGDTYSFGTDNDRALGELRSGSLVPTLGAIFTNGTSQTLTNITIGYTGEQWRLGSTGRTVADRLDFQYSTTTTNLTATTGYTDFNALDFVPPVTSGTVGPLDGNNSTNRTVFTPVVLTGVSLAPGASLTIRFQDVDATGADDGLAIDDFSFQAAGSGPYPTVPNGTATTALISEYRTGTTATPADEYVEIYNVSGAPLNLNGYSVVAGAANPGATVYTFSTSTIVPTRGHLLLTGSGYSLNQYATKDGDLLADLPTNGGVAILNPSGQIVDQVGVAGFVEGSGVPAAPASGNYAYVRKVLLGGNGDPTDTGNNSTDFALVSTASTAGAGSLRMGAPGPENLSSPIQVNGSVIYSNVGNPSRIGAPSGTLTLRRRIFNNSPATITSLRLRAVDVSAGTGGGNGIADTRLASGNGTTSPGINGVDLPDDSVGFSSLTLEAPDQPNGGGMNSTLTTGPILLPPGQTIDIEYTLNVVSGGNYRVVASFEVTTLSANPTPTPTTGPTATPTPGAGTPTPTPTSGPNNDNMLLGNPTAAVEGTTTEGSTDENNRLVIHEAYDLGFNRSLGGPRWASWHLDAADTGSSGRTDAWATDPSLPPASQITYSDYSSSGQTRGHQCPSGDRTSTTAINKQTFYMSNMLPQIAALNNGPWGSLEDYLRSATSGTNEAYIVSGGIYPATPATIAGGKVKVPSFCWKVAIIIPAGTDDISRITASSRGVAVIMPNTSAATGSWTGYITTVDAVEAQTGLDLFANLPDNVEAAIEAKTGNGN